jgi:transposase-like protein
MKFFALERNRSQAGLSFSGYGSGWSGGCRALINSIDHKHLKSTNVLERLNQELKRRTHVIRIFPNPESCLRLIRGPGGGDARDWLETHRYLNMEALREQRKTELRDLKAAA